MDNTFLCKSMFTWYKEMLNLDQQVTDETIIIAAEVRSRSLLGQKIDIFSRSEFIQTIVARMLQVIATLLFIC